MVCILSFNWSTVKLSQSEENREAQDPPSSIPVYLDSTMGSAGLILLVIFAIAVASPALGATHNKKSLPKSQKGHWN